jgi:hypothetical protein
VRRHTVPCTQHFRSARECCTAFWNVLVDACVTDAERGCPEHRGQHAAALGLLERPPRGVGWLQVGSVHIGVVLHAHPHAVVVCTACAPQVVRVLMEAKAAVSKLNAAQRTPVDEALGRGHEVSRR